MVPFGGPSPTSKMDLCQWPEAVLLLVLVEPGLECRCHSSESSPSLLSCPRGHVELPGDGRGWRGREPGGGAGGQEGGQPMRAPMLDLTSFCINNLRNVNYCSRHSA